MALKKELWNCQELLKHCDLGSLEDLRYRGCDGIWQTVYRIGHQQFLSSLGVHVAPPGKKKKE